MSTTPALAILPGSEGLRKAPLEGRGRLRSLGGGDMSPPSEAPSMLSLGQTHSLLAQCRIT